MTTLQGGWGRQGPVADRTCEDIDEVVHGRAGILAGQDSLRESIRDQDPHVM
jgi:hypothetical protein